MATATALEVWLGSLEENSPFEREDKDVFVRPICSKPLKPLK